MKIYKQISKYYDRIIILRLLQKMLFIKNKRCSFLYYVLVFVLVFDFMSVPQVGFTAAGTVIPRTAEEDKVFRECLASISVLYSTFQVLVCDEVPEDVPSYFDSGWCFSELVTASLGGQLAVFSPKWAASAST